MRIICISDTHGLHRSIRNVPSGDLLLHAGDFTMHGDLDEVEDFNAWLKEQAHRHKVVIAGNHDWCAQRDPQGIRHALNAVHYLDDQAIVIEGLKIYGSPWQPTFLKMAFNLERGPALAEKWQHIDEDTNILVTHCPAKGVLDSVRGDRGVGCEDLLARLKQLQQLRLHVFGHIHEEYGATECSNNLGHKFGAINASICTLDYRPSNRPIIYDLATFDAS